MIKILVADLLDTLLPVQPDCLNVLYGTRENVDFFQKRNDDISRYWNILSNHAMNGLIEELKLFLEQGNELVIVTSLSHYEIDGMFDYIKKIYLALPQYSTQIKVVFKGQEDHLINNKVIIENGLIYLVVQGVKIGFVYKKEDAFNFIDTSKKKLYTIGNDCLDDSGMMLRSFDANGSVSLIDYYLNNKFPDDYKILHNYIVDLIKTKIDLGLIKFSDYRKEVGRLLEKYNSGKISVEDIYKLYDLYGIVKGYNIDQRFGNFQNRGQIITNSEYIDSFVSSASVYPSFKEYNRRVLVKK